MTDDRERLLLETIAYGDESSAAERIRALELLRGLNVAPVYRPSDEIAAMPEEKLDGLLDDLVLRDAVTAIIAAERGESAGPLGLDPDRFPQTRETIEGEIRRVKAEAEKDVEERVKARSRWLLEREIGRSSESLSDASAAETGAESDPRSNEPSVAPSASPRPIPPGIDLSLGWPSRRPARRRRIG